MAVEFQDAILNVGHGINDKKPVDGKIIILYYIIWSLFRNCIFEFEKTDYVFEEIRCYEKFYGI